MAFRKSRKWTPEFMKRAFPIIFILFLIFIAPSISSGQVQTRLRIIQASNVGSGVDPSLRDIHRQLGTLFNFTSYRLLRDENITLSPNRPAIIQAHPGRSIEINLLGYRKDFAELRLKIKRDGEEMLNTQVRLSSGRTVIIGGPKHDEGVVILAISTRF